MHSFITYSLCFCRHTAGLFLCDKEREDGTWRYRRQWWNPAQIKHWGPRGRSGKGNNETIAWAHTLANKLYFYPFPPICFIYLIVADVSCFVVRIQVSSLFPLLGLLIQQLRAQLRVPRWMLYGRGTRAPSESTTHLRMGCTSLVLSRLMCKISILASMIASMVLNSLMEIILLAAVWTLTTGTSPRTQVFFTPGKQTAAIYSR